jgi:hypothetical protein
MVSFSELIGPAEMSLREGSLDYWQSKMKSVVLADVVFDGLVQSDRFSFIYPFYFEYWGVK